MSISGHTRLIALATWACLATACGSSQNEAVPLPDSGSHDGDGSDGGTAADADASDAAGELDAPLCPENGSAEVVAVDPEPSLTAGWDFYCGRNRNGEAICWPDTLKSSDPPPGRFIQISSGASHSCGIREDDSVECWGSGKTNDSCSALGGSVAHCGQSIPPPGRFVQVAAGYWHTCGIRPNGTAECWGANDSGQAAPPCGRFVQLTAGPHATCGVLESGKLVCWGAETTLAPAEYRQVSLGLLWSCGIRTDGELYCQGIVSIPPKGAPVIGFVTDVPALSASAGANAACWIRPDQTVECRGTGLPPEMRFVEIATGNDEACGVTEAGEVLCWGDDDWGETTVPASFP